MIRFFCVSVVSYCLMMFLLVFMLVCRIVGVIGLLLVMKSWSRILRGVF